MLKNYLIVGLVIILSSLAYAFDDWVIDGNKVYINDSNVYISVTPHTTSGGEINLELESKVYTGDINLIFGFNKDYVSPTSLQVYSPYNITIEKNYTCDYNFNYTLNPKYAWCYYTEEGNISNGTQPYNVTIFEHSFLSGNIQTKTIYWEEYKQIDYRDYQIDKTVVNYNYSDMNRWIVGKNLPIVEDKLYQAKINLEIKLKQTQGKYWVCVMPSSYGLNVKAANEAGHLYCLDPWWNASYLNKIPINCSELDSDIPFYVNGSGGFDLSSNTQLAMTTCQGDGMAVYYNSYDDWVIANDTAIIPFDAFRANVTSSSPTDVYDSSIQGMWHFEYNATDSTSNGNDGSVTGATLTTSGAVGSAYSFDGNDYIYLADNLFTTDNAGSIAAWIYYSTSTGYKTVFNQGNAGSVNAVFSIRIEDITDKMIFIFRTNLASNIKLMYSTSTIPQDQWVHIVVVSTGSAYKMYINGNEDTVIADTGANDGLWFNDLGTFTRKTKIGATTSGGSILCYFNGIIDEVIIYNRTLSADEINQTYQNYLATGGFGDIYTESTDSCTYSGSGDWTITISDNCTLSEDTNIYPNALKIVGDDGILTINATINAKEIHKTPSDFDGGYIIRILTDGILGVIK